MKFLEERGIDQASKKPCKQNFSNLRKKEFKEIVRYLKKIRFKITPLTFSNNFYFYNKSIELKFLEEKGIDQASKKRHEHNFSNLTKEKKSFDITKKIRFEITPLASIF